MSFSAPAFLLLLLALPFLVWVGRPSRGPSRRREIISLALRLVIAVLLILGLAGLEVRRAADALSVVYLVDHSDSMPLAARQVALDYVRRALAGMGLHDRSGVIVFGGEALVERPLSASKELGGFTSSVTSLQTDLAEAIRLGLALLPVDTARRMVILSDGIETTGDAVEAARLAAASGVEILVVPFATRGGAEAVVADVTAPAHLRQGEQFGLEVTIEASVDQLVGVRVLAGTAVVHEGTLELRRGTNAYTLPLTAGEPGFAEYRVQIIPVVDNDTFYQNNELAAFSQIAGPPRVLLVKNPSPRDGIDEATELTAALGAANILVDVVNPSGLPSELASLSEYVSVILVDVPASSQLSGRQMLALQSYVRDLGGGLVVVGGPTSYGVGGYFRTPLEETLPVEMQIKDQLRRPRLTIVFIIDKSGSMADTSGGPTKVELAKEAAIRSVDLLAPTDKVGVVAFDDSASWVVPITTLDQRDAIVNGIGSIRADGGTDIFAGVQAASRVLPEDDAAVKHIILLTDGGADPTGIAEMIRAMHADYGITLSTVGVGSDAAPFLPDLAVAGGGIYHFAADAASIPSIFTEETTLATRAYIIEEEFFPRQVNPSPMLAGVDGVPALLGYVGTTAKEPAQTVLISSQDDPILAAWQYGLGRSVAWTSDATGRWAKNWVTWEQFARFWAQVVRYTISAGAQPNVEVRVGQGEGQAQVTVDARAENGDYLNSLTMQVNVVAPDGSVQTLTLEQVAPGRYAGSFTPAVEGAYLIRVAGSDPEQAAGAEAAVAQTAGWVLSYSPEYRSFTADPNFLARVAAVTGGGVLGDDLSAIYAHNLPAPRAAARPVWPALLLLAAVLLPLDIAVRRLVVTRYEIQRAWQRVRAWLALRRPAAAAVPHQRAEQLTTLMRAKGRAGTEAKPPGGETPLPPGGTAVLPPIVTRPPTTDDGLPARGSASAAPPPAEPAASPASIKPTATSAALLARKRARSKGEPPDKR
ncbi:MAG: VWA domain-containing protein [Anaerolineales bacterium]|nr:VWA domain-containing protein [Anaerolineales bacterium]